MSKRKPRKNKKHGGGKTLDIAALIDERFAEIVRVDHNGTIRVSTCFRAITHQLWSQSIGDGQKPGNRKARKLYMRYLKFAATKVPLGNTVEIRFGPDLLTAEEVHRKHGREMP